MVQKNPNHCSHVLLTILHSHGHTQSPIIMIPLIWCIFSVIWLWCPCLVYCVRNQGIILWVSGAKGWSTVLWWNLKLQELLHDRKEHTMKIPNSFYIPVWSHHWFALSTGNKKHYHHPLPNDITMEIFFDDMVLQWNQQEHQHAISLWLSWQWPGLSNENLSTCFGHRI